MADSSHDKTLGMQARITRRDLFHGVGAMAVASAVSGRLFAAERGAPYPPALTGMRGSHDGSFEVAHALAFGGQPAWGKPAEAGEFDLVVVGGGISGLSAAYFYRRQKPDARILVLDNHDDFGGHAKRNEFVVDGETLLGYGGAQTVQEPGKYPEVAKQLLEELGFDDQRFYSAYDREFHKRHGLGAGLHFSRAQWDESRMVRCDLGAFSNYLFLADNAAAPAVAVSQMPIAAEAREQILRLLTLDDQHPEISETDKREWLYSITYKQFLTDVVGFTHPDAFRVMDTLSGDAGPGIGAADAGLSMLYFGLPGANAVGLVPEQDEEPYIHHFPDGNASIARLLVRSMIPGIAGGDDMEDIATAQLDYSMLDDSCNKVRIRLNSTAIEARNVSGNRVAVTYVSGNEAYRVSAKHCVMACNNRMIPSLCPELADKQKEALMHQVRRPILYTNVALRNWRAWVELGIGVFASPEEYHWNAKLDFPVSLGDYAFSESPDDPVIVHMERFPGKPNFGLSMQDQYRAGRAEMLNTSFETIERHTRSQLADALGPGGFDPARDIAGITVNRWSHGYSWDYDFLGDDTYYEDWNDPRYPHVIGRQPFGNISVANADAGALALMHVSIEQADRAVKELIS